MKPDMEQKLEQLAKAIDRRDAFVNDVMTRIENSPVQRGNVAEASSFGDKTGKPNSVLRRILMKNPLKLTAAAAILIAAVLSLTLLDTTVTPAYALEQTIEAMRNVTTVHCFARDWQDREMEMWIKVNPETGENDCHYVDEPQLDRISISTPQITHFYYPKENLVTVVKGQALRSDIRFGRYIEDILDKIIEPEHGEVQITKEHDPDTGKEVILLWAKSLTYEMEVLIDPETKLPIRINFEKAIPGQNIKNVDRIYYNEPLPEGLFDFKIPKDARVDLRLSGIEDPDFGISAEGLTRDEARVKIIRKFWNHVIGRDFESAHRLLPIVSAGQIENTLGSFGGVAELVSVGEPFEEPDTHDEVVTPVRVRFSNGKVWDIYQITRFRSIDGKPSCVLAGEEKKCKTVE